MAFLGLAFLGVAFLNLAFLGKALLGMAFMGMAFLGLTFRSGHGLPGHNLPGLVLNECDLGMALGIPRPSILEVPDLFSLLDSPAPQILAKIRRGPQKY